MKQYSLLLVCLVACGGADTDDATSAIITVEEGGSVHLANHQVDFPANSVSEDTEISIELARVGDFAAEGTARDQVLAFSPDGLALNAPATVTLDPGEPAITAGQTIAVVQFVDGGWYPTGSNAQLVSGGLVTADIDVLAPVAITVTDAPTGSIAGNVFHIYTEEPLADMGFELQQGEQVIATATSDTSGAFAFDSVAVGDYTVHATISANDNCFNDPVDKQITVSEGEPVEVFFGFVPGPCE